MKPRGGISANDINDTLKFVTHQVQGGDRQLALLTYALVVGCQSCGVSQECAIENIKEVFALGVPLSPLYPQLKN